jgi:hypothetical protein
MLETRFTEIERENRILLEKMTQIMHNNKQSYNSKTLCKFENTLKLKTSKVDLQFPNALYSSTAEEEFE